MHLGISLGRLLSSGCTAPRQLAQLKGRTAWRQLSIAWNKRQIWQLYLVSQAKKLLMCSGLLKTLQRARRWSSIPTYLRRVAITGVHLALWAPSKVCPCSGAHQACVGGAPSAFMPNSEYAPSSHEEIEMDITNLFTLISIDGPCSSFLTVHRAGICCAFREATTLLRASAACLCTWMCQNQTHRQDGRGGLPSSSSCSTKKPSKNTVRGAFPSPPLPYWKEGEIRRGTAVELA